MGFEKGHPKFGGRQKGSLNKSKTVKERLAELNFDLISEIYKEINLITEPRERFAALIKLFEFVEPKLKAIEHSGDIDHDHTHDIKVTKENIMEVIKAARGEK